MKLREVALMTLLMLAATASCGDDDEVVCPSSATPVGGEACVVFEGSLSESDRTAIEAAARALITEAGRLVDIGVLRIRVIVDPSRVIPEIAAGGFAPDQVEILIFVDPASDAWPIALDLELRRQMAHELHHTLRRRAVGYGSTLGEAVVSEGLADHFSIEVFGGEVPPWSAALDGEALAEWVARVEDAWDQRPYDHATWFFGGPETPRWTGYAVGFEVVGRHLEADPSRRPSALVGTPESSFRPED